MTNTTTTADKGEQECREAFEKTFKDYYVKHGFISSKEEAFAFYQAALNRRPTCEQQRTTNEGQDWMTDEDIDGIARECGLTGSRNHRKFARYIARHLSTHPVSDDQQAKDAALKMAIDYLEPRLANQPGSHGATVVLPQLRAALSTTKQEEV